MLLFVFIAISVISSEDDCGHLVSRVKPIAGLQNPSQQKPNWDLVRKQGLSPSTLPVSREKDSVEISEEARAFLMMVNAKLADLGIYENRLPAPEEIVAAYRAKMKESQTEYNTASGPAAANDRRDEVFNQGRYRDAFKFFQDNGYVSKDENP